MHTAAQTLRDVNIVAYTALGAVALLFWQRRRDRAAGWAAAAFALLAAVELLSLLPNHSGNGVEAVFARVEILLLVLFPYVLFRFTGAFRRPGRRLANGLVVLTAVLAIWTFALPSIPRSGEHWPPVFAAFVVLFAVHWVTLSVVSAVRLWRAGAGLPTVSRRRTRLMAGGASALALALILAASSSHASSGIDLGSQVLATISVATFLVGFAPPRLVRALWRRAEQERVQQAVLQLLTFAESQEEVAGRVLEPAAAIVGARALAIRNAEGRIVAAWNVPDGERRTLEEREEPPRLWEDAEVPTSTSPAAGSSCGRRRTRRSSGTRSSRSSSRWARSRASHSTACASTRRSTRRGSPSSGRTRSSSTSLRSPRTSCGRR